MPDRAESVLRFWFGEPGADTRSVASRWFSKDPALDREISLLFGEDVDRAGRGELDAWATRDASHALALVVLLDQFPRNVFRDSPRMFAQDARALGICLRGQDRGSDRDLSFIERYMFYMPMMHAEDRAVQQRGVTAFVALAREAKAAAAPEGLQAMLQTAHEYAARHAAIVERFGRFPHRNALLGRESTAEEAAFLKEPGSSF